MPSMVTCTGLKLPVGGKGGKSKGGSKGAPFVATSQSEENFALAIQDAMPLAARHRLMPRLESEEWSVPVKSYSELDMNEGIALVYKSNLVDVVRRVGYTQSAVAVLTTQPAEQSGLRGYPCEHVQCTMYVKDNAGVEKMIITQRYLIQLGFGKTRVHKVAIGQHVVLTTTMVKVAIKMPSYFGWSDEMCTGTTIAKYLADRIPAPAFDAIQVRMDLSATALVHVSGETNSIKWQRQHVYQGP